MSEQEPEASNQEPTGESFDGAIFGEDWLDPNTGQKVDMPSVEPGRVFIPKAWRGELGLDGEDAA
jgi:hypothetical protein